VPKIITIVCDKCGATVAEDVQVIFVRGRGPSLERKDCYFCDGCSREFRAWLKAGAPAEAPITSRG
jgi:hypothetical protein